MIGGGWEPTLAQELLLTAALGPESQIVSAWSAWRTATEGRDLDKLEGGTARLLPLLMPRLRYLPPDDPLLPMIRGYYRRSFYHSQLLRHRAAGALAALAAAGIRTLISKGGLLGTTYYEHPGLRPMNDFDVLVPSTRALEAMRVLAAGDWQSTMPAPERLPLAYHGVCFTSPDAFDLDLHWHLLPEACFADADEPAWRTAEPVAINGVASLGLAPTELLVVVCAHAAHWQPLSPALDSRCIEDHAPPVGTHRVGPSCGACGALAHSVASARHARLSRPTLVSPGTAGCPPLASALTGGSHRS